MERHTEQNQETLFGFGIDQSSRAHLADAAKWAKFLAIVGFIVCGLAAVVGVFTGLYLSIMSEYTRQYNSNPIFGNNMGVFVLFFYLAIAILYFFPCLFLLKFANRMRTALNTDDQLTLNNSFQNLKKLFRYMGILTIVIISIYIVVFLFAIIFAATSTN